MSAAEYEFKVELYQINCSEDSVGEAAIMLVLRRQQGTAEYEIAYSILIDCGLHTKAAEQVFRTIEYIEAKYPGDFRFDTVVISHWDKVCIYIGSIAWPSLVYEALLKIELYIGSLQVGRSGELVC